MTLICPTHGITIFRSCPVCKPPRRATEEARAKNREYTRRYRAGLIPPTTRPQSVAQINSNHIMDTPEAREFRLAAIQALMAKRRLPPITVKIQTDCGYTGTLRVGGI